MTTMLSAVAGPPAVLPVTASADPGAPSEQFAGVLSGAIDAGSEPAGPPSTDEHGGGPKDPGSQGKHGATGNAAADPATLAAAASLLAGSQVATLPTTVPAVPAAAIAAPIGGTALNAANGPTPGLALASRRCCQRTGHGCPPGGFRDLRGTAGQRDGRRPGGPAGRTHSRKPDRCGHDRRDSRDPDCRDLDCRGAERCGPECCRCRDADRGGPARGHDGPAGHCAHTGRCQSRNGGRDNPCDRCRCTERGAHAVSRLAGTGHDTGRPGDKHACRADAVSRPAGKRTAAGVRTRRWYGRAGQPRRDRPGDCLGAGRRAGPQGDGDQGHRAAPRSCRADDDQPRRARHRALGTHRDRAGPRDCGDYDRAGPVGTPTRTGDGTHDPQEQG